LGVCVRNVKGNILYAQDKEIGDLSTTNTEAEELTILHALKYIEMTQLDRVIMETDSLLIKHIVEGTWKVPWKL